MDTALELLRTMQLTGGIFLDAEFAAPWCVTAGVEPEDCHPFFPLPRSIIAYHYVSAGSLMAEVAGEPPMVVNRNEIILLPRNDRHRLGSALDVPAVSAESLIQPADGGGPARIRFGGDGARTRILCGFLGSDMPANPVINTLPKVLKVSVADGATGAWIESSFRFAAQELSGGSAPSLPVLAKVAELLFTEAVRRYLASLPPARNGWLAGLRDPAVARALTLLHARMEHHWTAEALAQEVNLSRSAFADRFTRLVGEPPMRYLTKWRMQSAARRLKESRDPIARIAAETGYESEAAFHRAFKREFGMPPAAWRNRSASMLR